MRCRYCKDKPAVLNVFKLCEDCIAIWEKQDKEAIDKVKDRLISNLDKKLDTIIELLRDIATKL